MSTDSQAPLPQPRDLAAHVGQLYSKYGQRKPMGQSSPSPERPHFFLLRTFLEMNDLLVILNTLRCRYRCFFCELPAKSSPTWIADAAVLEQFWFVTDEVRHALSIVERVSLSNEGSVLDETTLGRAVLDEIVRAIGNMRQVRRIELETRMEFVEVARLRELAQLAPRAQLGILTGFETVTAHIRDRILSKREPLSVFLAGLDRVAAASAALTAYVLLKPDPTMSDQEAVDEARASISFLVEECASRGVPLTIRLNLMYVATGSRWGRQALALPTGYVPPRLTDAMRVAEEAVAAGTPVYIGLSDEGLGAPGLTYHSREDFKQSLIRLVKEFNDRNRTTFPWDQIAGMTS